MYTNKRGWTSRTQTAMAVLLLFSFALGACSQGNATVAPTAAAPTTAPAAQKTLIVAQDAAIDTFDPCCTVGSKYAQTAIQNTFDQLTQYQQVQKTLPDGTKYMTVDTSQIIGMLAQSWQQSGDTVTFKLRPGLTFANGDPITAQTIVDGYHRIFDAGGLSSFLLIMGSVTSYTQFSAVDNLTVQMKLGTANNLVNLNNVMHNASSLDPLEVAKHQTATDPMATAYFKTNLASGSGPFVMSEYVPGDHMTLTANKNYYGGQAKLDKVIIKEVPDAEQRVLLLKSGQVDMIMIPPITDLADLQKDPNIRVVSVPSTQNRMLEMNNAMAPFDNKLVRQAVSYAIPYDTLLNKVWLGYAQPLKSPIANGTPTSDFSSWHYTTNLDTAKQLLAQAGFPGGQGLPPIQLTVRIGTAEDEKAAVFIQDSLSQIGMKVDINKMAFAAFQEQEAKRQIQFWIDEWISWVNDPYYHLSWIYSSSSPLIYTNYKNPQVDALIAKYTLWGGAQAERDQASQQIQKMVIDDAPIAYLLAPNFNVAMRKNVTGYVYYNDELNRYFYMDKTP